MSITSETRREAHESIDKERRRVAILRALRAYGAMTAEEITERLFVAGDIPAFDHNAVRPRLTELKADGILEVVGKRESRRSGRNTAIWSIKEEKVNVN